MQTYFEVTNIDPTLPAVMNIKNRVEPNRMLTTECRAYHFMEFQIMNKRKHLNRRRFLQSAGIALSLPVFESFAYGSDVQPDAPRRLVCVGNHLGFYPGNFFPKTAGMDYVPTSTLKPLEAHRKDLTVFSHLDHGLNGGHRTVQSFLTSVKKEEAAGFPEKNISLDQAAAEHAGSSTRFPSIQTGILRGTDMCWNRAGVHLPPINNPAKLFRGLFVNLPQSAREAERARLKHRTSVLDALRDSANALNRTLNPADRDKLDQYLTSIRDVERRLQMSNKWLNRPKPDPQMNEILNEERQHIDEVALFYDLMALALQTESTRVATLETGMGLRTAELDLDSYHSISHHSKSEDRIGQLQVVETFLTTKLSGFISRLKEAQIFDKTLIIFGSGMSDGSIHSNRNLPVLLAGGGIRHKGHLVCPEAQHMRIPLSNLWLSTLQWFGSESDQFGRSKGTFSPMEIA
ncbi:MAG TPA: hypothetical protein DCR61_08830 [Verrucomicrobiales bacterium]|nr:hypothetical protein [Verrucomicrobiales bacterium]HAW02681.1 hypothetical protein [Verrucomicrobiales bacterium]HCP36832.1 hypothetical protein [Verrucomicrobiales bacterium]HCZ02670.1 hypothetical protein [Verrucomicrobiales bacterium]|tara:strand:+ start:1905 stop:3284 length:1380 start_codon:yes stop_codon:yes gene_type:complete